MVPVAGTRLHLYITGAGAPTVVLEAGIAATSLGWALVQGEIARFARTVSYDRAGLGWSGAATTPRTPGHIAAELRAALNEAGLEPPFILVGHSFGGLAAARFAIDYEQDVAGLVLVDPLNPAEFQPLTPDKQRMLARAVTLSRRGAWLAKAGVVGACLRLALSGNSLIPKLAARVSSGKPGTGLTSRLAGEIRKLPRETWPAIAAHWSEPKNFEGMAQHLETLPRSCAEMLNASLPSMPTVSIAAAANKAGVGMMLPAAAEARVAAQSGHWIQLDEPGLVVDAVRDVIAKIRSGGA